MLAPPPPPSGAVTGSLVGGLKPTANTAGVPLPPPRRSKLANPTYKVLLVGDCGVGKSNLLARFTDNKFDLHSRSTIGVEFVTREVNVGGAEACFAPAAAGGGGGGGGSGATTSSQEAASASRHGGTFVNMQIWDTAGQERCSQISSAYYRGAKGVVVVYDTTSRASLLNVPRWVAHAKQFCDDNAVFLVVGNKCDLTNLREVTEEEAEEIAHILGIRHYYASALTGDGVPIPFFQLILAIHAIAVSDAAEALVLGTPASGEQQRANGNGASVGGGGKNGAVIRPNAGNNNGGASTSNGGKNGGFIGGGVPRQTSDGGFSDDAAPAAAPTIRLGRRPGGDGNRGAGDSTKKRGPSCCK